MSKEKEAMPNGQPPLHHKVSSAPDEPVPFPVSAEHVERPPTYEEIMGHQTQSSVIKQEVTSDLPPLAYIDIMPRMLDQGNIKYRVTPTFDKFSYLIDVANQWLRGNPGFAVWKCETVERKVEQGPNAQIRSIINLDKMVSHHSLNGYNVFIRGIRMWVVRKTDNSPPQQMGLFNVVPEKKAVRKETMKQYPLMYEDPYFRMAGNQHVVTYDGFKETIDKLNFRLKVHPIPGTILNVESATMKTFEGGSETEIDPDLTYYTSEQKFRRQTQILRIFYILGPPLGEQICLQEFLPAITFQGRRPHFQSWAELNVQLGGWLAASRGIRVVNIQTFNARYTAEPNNTYILSDCTDEVQTSVVPRNYIKIIRVFFTTGAPFQTQPVVNFGSRLFIPVRLGKNIFEGMAQTMYRIDAWLRATGVPIYNVETIQNIMDEFKQIGVDVEKCTWTENPQKGNHFVTAIRVYFPCVFMEPDPRYLPPAFVYNPNVAAGNEDCCSLS